jgi:tRNA (guanine6-N2)-methyltransferase
MINRGPGAPRGGSQPRLSLSEGQSRSVGPRPPYSPRPYTPGRPGARPVGGFLRRPPSAPYRRGPSDIAEGRTGDERPQFRPRAPGGYQSPPPGRPPLRPARPYAPRTPEPSEAPPRPRQFGPSGPRPEAPAQTQSFMAHVVPGLEELASEELERFAGITVGRTIRSMDDRSSVILFTYTGHPSELLGIRIVEEVFAVVATADRVPIGWDGLAAIRQLVARAADLPTALATFRSIRRTARPRPSFRVVARMSGDHAFRRLEVQHSVESGLREAGQGWMPGGEDADVEVWVHLIDRSVVVGLRLSDETTSPREYKEELQPESLKPTVAHAMVLLSRPRPDDIVLDPMCGAGTIITERAMHSRYRLLLAGDLDRQAVSATIRNVGSRFKPISIQRWDAGTLPLADGSVNAALATLPLGRHGASQGFAALYPRLVSEWARVVHPGGRMVLLTAERDTLEQVVADDHRLRISKRLSVVVRGLPATIFVLARVAG